MGLGPVRSSGRGGSQRQLNEAPWIENRSGRRRFGELLTELAASRETILVLARRDVTARTKQSFLGYLWPVAQPLTSAVTFLLVFNKLAKVEAPGTPYILFAFVGSMVWGAVSSAVPTAVSSMQYWTGLVTKLYMPRAILPIAAVLSTAVGLAISAVALAVLLVFFGTWPGWSVVLVPLWLVLLGLLAISFGLLFGSLQVRYRDVGRVVGFGMQIWLYASPVAYPSSLVPDRFQVLYHLNPLAGLLGALRWSTIGGPWTNLNLVSFAVLGLMLAAGLMVYAQQERSMADYL